jgi:hypothetical protein
MAGAEGTSRRDLHEMVKRCAASARVNNLRRRGGGVGGGRTGLQHKLDFNESATPIENSHEEA